MVIRLLSLALFLCACAATDPDQARRDATPHGPSISIGGGLGTYWGAGIR